MTETEVKNLLQDLVKKKIWYEILVECYGNKDGNQGSREERKRRLEIQIDIIEKSINVLSEEEKFIVSKHLIDGKRWKDTLAAYVEVFGKDRERSERTLKRIQKRAIGKMTKMLGKQDIEEWINGET